MANTLIALINIATKSFELLRPSVRFSVYKRLKRRQLRCLFSIYALFSQPSAYCVVNFQLNLPIAAKGKSLLVAQKRRNPKKK